MMNFSGAALVLLAAYLWYANSMANEINLVKKFLLLIYETTKTKFDDVTKLMSDYHETIVQNLEKLHNMTKHSIDLIVINSRKIDVINGKIDSLLDNK
uniref:GP16 n=1 Tax=Spodoptera frugiperda nuclear polyhedrosis virus TaxID=10455 RepID=A0A7G3W769_NPVSF|nr:GP16 [Spodoptera frugiperda multiple nucleopolyhedrovirus]